MNCPKCNSPLPSNQRFCGNCGAKLDFIDVNKTVAADDFVPEEQPSQNYGYTQPEDQPAQNYGYTQPEEQPAQNYGYTQPEEQPAQNYGYTQQPRDFSQQYQNYQQPSQYAGGHGSYSYAQNQGQTKTGIMTQKKTPIMIAIIVGAVLVIAGIVLGIVFGVKGCSDSKHRLTTSDGTLIIEDDDIDVTDSSAQTKIDRYLQDSGIRENLRSTGAQYSQYFSADATAKGNVALLTVKFTSSVTAEEKEEVKSMFSGSTGTSTVKSDTGVSNAVAVLAILNSDGSVYYKKIAK